MGVVCVVCILRAYVFCLFLLLKFSGDGIYGIEEYVSTLCVSVGHTFAFNLVFWTLPFAPSRRRYISLI